MKTLNKLRDEVHEIAKSKGFHDGRIDIPRSLMLIVSEISEAMEADRKDRYAQIESFDSYLKFANVSITDFDMNNENCEWVANKFESTIKDTFEDELADTIIRILDLCGAKGIDIEKHIELKMKYNATRERLHGKKY